MRSEKASKSLRDDIRTQEQMGMKGAKWQNETVARYTVREELGEFGPDVNYYDLNRVQADTLLAHARQDAAYALLNTLTIMKRQKIALFLNVITCLIAFFCLIILGEHK